MVDSEDLQPFRGGLAQARDGSVEFRRWKEFAHVAEVGGEQGSLEPRDTSGLGVRRESLAAHGDSEELNALTRVMAMDENGDLDEPVEPVPAWDAFRLTTLPVEDG